MTKEVMDFVRSLGLTGSCLDIGSYNVNGCVRALFGEYLGLDMRSGPNVDVVAMASKMPFSDSVFDVVTCLEMLEHDRDPFASVLEMRRVLKPHGHLVITVPGIRFPRHDYPSDYWRMTKDGLGLLFEGMYDVVVHEDKDHAYGVGRKSE